VNPARRRSSSTLQTIAFTSAALAAASAANPVIAIQVGRARASVDFADSLFTEIDSEDPLATIPLDSACVSALARVEEALRAIRVAAIALQEPEAESGRAVEQSSEGAAHLEVALRDFLVAFRSFTHDQGSVVQDAYSPIVERFEEQLEARQLVAEVRESRDEAERVLSDTRRAAGATGETSLAQHFGAYATKELWNANVLRALCVLALLAIAGGAALLLAGKQATELTTTREIAKLAITIPIAVLAAYLGREATRHRKIARRARELEIQLQTVDAFTHPLPESLRDQIRTELGKQVFTTAYVDQSDDKDAGPSTVNDAGMLIEKIADLLKTVAASRPS
jgi:hypothetical protein